MASGSAKAALFDALASVAQALGSGRRAEIVDLLAQGERSVDEIAREIDQRVANTSQHLQVLARSGLVRSRREGTRVFYRLERDGVEQLSAEELARRLARDQVVLLDVRPEREYRAGHIAGARSAPLAQLPSLLPELPRQREIVAYCRGPYCVYADDAVRLLRARGLKARRLEVGFPEWRRDGLPVETAS